MEDNVCETIKASNLPSIIKKILDEEEIEMSNEESIQSFREHALAWSCFMDPAAYKKKLSPEEWEMAESKFEECRQILQHKKQLFTILRERQARKVAEREAVWDARTEEQLVEWRKCQLFREFEEFHAKKEEEDSTDRRDEKRSAVVEDGGRWIFP